MTVRNLKKILNGFPDNLPVMLSSDSEGNSFSLLFHCEISKISDLDNSDVEVGDEALVLYPMR